MPRDGAGGYSLPSGNPVVTGTTISSTWANNTLTDIGTAIAGSISADGQTPWAGNQNANGARITSVGAASARTDAVQAAQVQDGSLTYLGAAAGTNTITASVSGLSAYAAGQVFRFIAATANTGPATLNINSIGAKAVTKNGAVALVGGEIQSGYVVTVGYDGTQFQLLHAVQQFAGAYTDVTASRAINTSYTNNTGRPLSVAVAVAGTVNNSTLALSWSIGGISTVSQTSVITSTPASNTQFGSTIIVPPGATYQLTVTQGSLLKWHEMS